MGQGICLWKNRLNPERVPNRCLWAGCSAAADQGQKRSPVVRREDGGAEEGSWGLVGTKDGQEEADGGWDASSQWENFAKKYVKNFFQKTLLSMGWISPEFKKLSTLTH